MGGGFMFNQRVGHVIKAIILSFLITAILILIFAFIMFKFNISENVIALGVTFIYIISCGFGGFYVGKTIGERKFMWGLLVGASYLVVLFVVSAIVGGDKSLLSENVLSLVLLCLGGGTLGGMLA